MRGEGERPAGGGGAVVAHVALKDGKDARTVTLVVVTAKVAGGKE